jgi:hypothetical protein
VRVRCDERKKMRRRRKRKLMFAKKGRARTRQGRAGNSLKKAYLSRVQTRMFVANQRGKYDSIPLALSRRRPDAVEMCGSGRKPDVRTYEDLLDLFCCSSLDSIKYGFLFTQRGSDGDLLVPCLPTSSLASAFR